jgi:hypothetical protein
MRLPQSVPSTKDSVLSPIARTAVSLEYAGLRYKDHCPLGMYVVPSTEDLLVWDGVFFVHQGQSLPNSITYRHRIKWQDRILHRFHTQVPLNISRELSGSTTSRSICYRCLSSSNITIKRPIQPFSPVSPMEVSSCFSKIATALDGWLGPKSIMCSMYCIG